MNRTKVVLLIQDKYISSFYCMSNIGYVFPTLEWIQNISEFFFFAHKEYFLTVIAPCILDFYQQNNENVTWT